MLKALIRLVTKGTVFSTKIHPSTQITEKYTCNVGKFYQSQEQYTGLVLTGQNIGDTGVSELFHSITGNTTLRELAIGWNKVSAEGIKGISSLLAGIMLNTLRVDNNHIGDQGAREIASFIKSNNTLKILSLNKNGIGEGGAGALADSLKGNNSLEDLSINGNHIGDAGATALAESLGEGGKLKNLRCDDNNIGDQGAINLATSLHNCNDFECISLNNNQIKNQGADAFFHVLRKFVTLKVQLIGNYIGNELEQRFSKFGTRVNLSGQHFDQDAEEFGGAEYQDTETQNFDDNPMSITVAGMDGWFAHTTMFGTERQFQGQTACAKELCVEDLTDEQMTEEWLSTQIITQGREELGGVIRVKAVDQQDWLLGDFQIDDY
jgi:Ran GTPase-activating protein (RanGAP) involved in mRNA processing and transport